MAEPPYDIIASNLTSGKVISSLSAGASFGRREPSDSKFDPFRQRFLPTKTALAAVTLHQLLTRATQSPSQPLGNLRQPETRL